GDEKPSRGRRAGRRVSLRVFGWLRLDVSGVQERQRSVERKERARQRSARIRGRDVVLPGRKQRHGGARRGVSGRLEGARPVQTRSAVEDPRFPGALLDPSGDFERATLSARSGPDLLLRREEELTQYRHETTR